jgi:hypothetical protein
MDQMEVDSNEFPTASNAQQLVATVEAASKGRVLL